MLRFLSTMILFCISIYSASGQLELADREHSVTLLDLKAFPEHPVQDAIIQPSDTEYEKLFKTYFHPLSFERFKSFFLPGDWGGFTVEEFNAWQSRINKDKLHLIYAMHIQANDGREFIICQYTMESTAYSIPESVKFKKVQGEWKHIHVRNDDNFRLLHQIGNLRLDYLEQTVKLNKTNLQVDQVPDQYKMMTVEKFDRQAIFKEIESILTEYGLSGLDMDTARNYFLQKDDQAFVEWVTAISGKHDLDFMQRVNDKVGIKLFNFTKAQND